MRKRLAFVLVGPFIVILAGCGDVASVPEKADMGGMGTAAGRGTETAMAMGMGRGTETAMGMGMGTAMGSVLLRIAVLLDENFPQLDAS